jgi:uncharacterized membrane protein
MPNIAAYHPQIVHLVIGFLLMGVVFRLVSLTGRFKFTNHAATVLLVLGTIAAVAAHRSGHDAHGPVERIPGVRAQVIEHERAADWARDIFLAVGVIELLALGLAASARYAPYVRYAHVASAVLGLWGGTALYRTADLGGALVYEFAGGPGLRTGNAADVERLLLAGLYQQAMADRRAGKPEDAARLIDEMGRRFSTGNTVRLLVAESLLLDRRNAAAALAAINAIQVDPENARHGVQRTTLRTDILLALGQADSAKAELTRAAAAYPENARIRARLDSMP